MTKHTIALQDKINKLNSDIKSLLDKKIVDIDKLTELNTELRSLEKTLEFIIDSNDSAE